jgi:acyl-coenzyme A thioesterase PaaI-like protein
MPCVRHRCADGWRAKNELQLFRLHEDRCVKIEYDESYQGCFVCGRENERGLQLDFQYDDQNDEMHTSCTFPSHMQGYSRIVHGGFISMLLDEVMAKACLYRDIIAVTVKFEIRFKKPIYVDEELRFRGHIVEVRGRKIKTEATCLDGSGELRAYASALFMSQ